MDDSTASTPDFSEYVNSEVRERLQQLHEQINSSGLHTSLAALQDALPRLEEQTQQTIRDLQGKLEPLRWEVERQILDLPRVEVSLPAHLTNPLSVMPPALQIDNSGLTRLVQAIEDNTAALKASMK